MENTTLKLPELPDIKKINRNSLNRDDKINNQIIKPKDKIIKQLHNENIALHKELSKQTKIIDVAEKYEKENSN